MKFTSAKIAEIRQADEERAATGTKEERKADEKMGTELSGVNKYDAWGRKRGRINGVKANSKLGAIGRLTQLMAALGIEATEENIVALNSHLAYLRQSHGESKEERLARYESQGLEEAWAADAKQAIKEYEAVSWEGAIKGAKEGM